MEWKTAGQDGSKDFSEYVPPNNEHKNLLLTSQIQLCTTVVTDEKI